MQGNLHVRFGGGDGETYGSNAVRRPIPTLPAPRQLPFADPERISNEPASIGAAFLCVYALLHETPFLCSPYSVAPRRGCA